MRTTAELFECARAVKAHLPLLTTEKKNAALLATASAVITATRTICLA